MDATFQVNVSRLPKRKPCSRAGIYIGNSPFNSGSVALVINPSTGHASSQFHVVFDDEFSTVSFKRYGTIPPNWTDLMLHRSQSGATDNIDLKDNWFNPDLEEGPIKTPSHKPIIAPDNINKMITFLQ